MLKHLFAIPLALALATGSLAQQSPQTIALWEGGAPGFEDRRDEPEQAESYWVKNVHNPTITAYLPDPDKATGAAVVICPGGGHRLLVYKAEGVEAAEHLNKLGVAAFVLKYRLGREEGSPYKIEEHALADGQRAIRLVRSRAAEWNIDPQRVGIMGFSAGGEVVSMVAYADAPGNPNADDPVERASAEPDFQILIYPGPLGIPEGEVSADAPPAFLLVANDDVGAARSIYTLLPKLREAGVPFEAHLYSRGGHAFNMGNRSKLAGIADWPARLEDWLQDNFILNPEGREEYDAELQKARERRQVRPR